MFGAEYALSSNNVTLSSNNVTLSSNNVTLNSNNAFIHQRQAASAFNVGNTKGRLPTRGFLPHPTLCSKRPVSKANVGVVVMLVGLRIKTNLSSMWVIFLPLAYIPGRRDLLLTFHPIHTHFQLYNTTITSRKLSSKNVMEMTHSY